MNGVAMFLQQMQIPENREKSVNPLEEGEKNALFHTLLSSMISTDMLNDEQEQKNEEEAEIPLLFPVNQMINQISADEEMNKMQRTEAETHHKASITEGIPQEIELKNMPAVHQTLIHIFREAQTILTQLSAEPVNIDKAAQKLLPLLQDWVKTAGNGTDQKGMEITLTSTRQEESKEQIIWKDLLQAFGKRQQLASKQQYSPNALVRTEDIARWLVRAMEQAPLQNRLPVHHVSPPQSLPISQVEQVVVHLNQGQSLHEQGQQLVDQFRVMMKSSNFMTAPSKGSQIILSLRPENLGEMMIRFSQVNGEMAVKILVTTQAAKEMLETNMHQLRNMFSPQQVVVEKQDAHLPQSQETEENLKDDQSDGQNQQSSDSSDEEKEKSDDDFAAKFQAVLMNEEV